MLRTRELPVYASVLLLGLTLGCDPLSIAPPDTGAEIQGMRFRSVEFQEVAVSAHGIPTLGRWQIAFGDGEFDSVQGQRGQSGSYTGAGPDVTGLATDGHELGGTFDPGTGLLSWDGINYLDENVAADAEVCAAIHGNSFTALEVSEAGNGPAGIIYGRSRISFEAGEFRWTYSDIQETGTYTCVDGQLIAKRLDGSLIPASYDPVTGILTFDGAPYGDPREFPDADS